MVGYVNDNENFDALVFDSYITHSFLVALLVGIFHLCFQSMITVDSFYLSLLVVSSYYFYVYGRGYSHYLRETSWWPLFFLQQVISLIGISYIDKNVGGVYMGLIPVAFGFYFFSRKRTRERKPVANKGFVLLVISVFLYMVFMGITNHNLLNMADTFYLGLFALWTTSLIYWGHEHLYNPRRSGWTLLTLRNEKQEEKEVPGEWTRERLFFHDIINHTHGINLYLGQKIASENQTLKKEDLIDLREEVKIIQSLIKDHYGFGHRNLFSVYDFVSFDFAKKSIMRMVRQFLPEPLVECHFEFKGWIAEDADPIKRQQCILHYPSFHRIWGNLIKNISEVKTDYVTFSFDYNENGLNIVIANKVCYLKENASDLANHLSEIILGRVSPPQINSQSGMGLDSVATLCQDHGGDFSFSMQGDFWVSKVHLPNPSLASCTSSNNYSKAA